TAFSGSTRNSQTVSGLAAIASSRSTVVVSAVASTCAPFLSFGFALQRVEPLVPERLEEGPQLGKALRSGAVEAPRAVSPFVHEPGLLQDRQVLRHRRPRHVEVLRDLARRQLPVADEREDPAAARLRDRFQGGVHGRLFKQILT